MHLTIHELMHYTAEERERWERWFLQHGDDLLAMPIAGSRETTIGQLIMHIFGPELRYVQRLRNDTVTEYRGFPSSTLGAVFGFGLKTRQAMREFVDALEPDDWNRVAEFAMGEYRVKASVRKIVFHVYLHELRHWAQIARLVRERGFEPPGGHDLLTSSSLD